MKRRTFQFYLLINFGLLIFMCVYCMPGIKRKVSNEYIPPLELNKSLQYLKTHMKDGSLYVLNKWFLSDSNRYMRGYGEHYDANRNLLAARSDSLLRIETSKIALFESNSVNGLGGLVGLQTMIMLPTAIVTIYCALNPKACFGSCPTFYAWDGTKMRLMAEGFSSSIARAFEKSDIDMLHSTVVTGREFRLQMTNEALETHAVRFADLLVVPREKEERIFATPAGHFYSSKQIIHPASCNAPEGDCLSKVMEMDQSERFSTADSSNLTRKENLDVIFKNVPKGRFGLIVGSRQTLMTTFLFYQGMAHAGTNMARYLAQVEAGNKTMQRHMTRLWDLLGGIEILIQEEDGTWRKIDELDETGPIASDLQMVTLPGIRGETVNIRLRMTRGLWRIDQLALVSIDREVKPMRIQPALVQRENIVDDTAKNLLNDTTQYLLTLPGDRFDLVYELPETSQELEVFLYSKGYYLEWMREDWLKEEDNFKMAVMFTFPKYYLRMMAPKFKEVEPFMEMAFWNSRYVKK